MKLWSCWDGHFTQPHFFLGSCCGISRGRGGEYSDILVLYVGADHFWEFQNFKFQYFLGFSRKENESFWRGGGYEEFVDIFWRQLQNLLFWGSFLYMFFKTKVQNGNVFGGSQNFKSFFFLGGGGWGGMPDIPSFGGWGWTVDAGSKPTHEEKLRVAPINDTFSVLLF